MRIATITNWAYGITVGLTLASGSAMLMASSADRVERQAVQQRQVFVADLQQVGVARHLGHHGAVADGIVHAQVVAAGAHVHVVRQHPPGQGRSNGQVGSIL